MGLACSQARLLTLTSRKADCELGISLDSMSKMALTREMTELSREYYSKLQSKQIAYYANGKYNKINYNYLMGYGGDFSALWNGSPIKEKNNMILTDYNGRVVLSETYANAITAVVGSGIMEASGKGGTFSKENIPAILNKLVPGFSIEEFSTVIDGKDFDPGSYTYEATGSKSGNSTTVDATDTKQKKCEAIVNFYYPIFAAAASNGWTTEYNKSMNGNEDYISDALVSGAFQLATVNKDGSYREDDSLTYFITAGHVEARNDSDVREEITAWYNSEKDKLTEKETYIDLHMDELSTELEAINTEIQSIQSLIDDAISSVFDWGSG